jgi:hypothetical protein
MPKQKKIAKNSGIEDDHRLSSGRGTLPEKRSTSLGAWEKTFAELTSLPTWEWYHPLAGFYLLMIRGNLVSRQAQVLDATHAPSHYFRIGDHAYEPTYARRVTVAHATAHSLLHTTPKDIQTAGNLSRSPSANVPPTFHPAWPVSEWGPIADYIRAHGNSLRPFYTTEDWKKRLRAEGEGAILMFEMAHHLHGKMADPSLSSHDKQWIGMAWGMCTITAIGHCCRFPLLTESDALIAKAKQGIEIHGKFFSLRNPWAHSESIASYQDAIEAISLADSMGAQSWMLRLMQHYFAEPSFLMSTAVAPSTSVSSPVAEETQSVRSPQPSSPPSSEKKSQKKNHKIEVKEKISPISSSKGSKKKGRGPTEEELFELYAQEVEAQRLTALTLSQTPKVRLEKALFAVYQGIHALPYKAHAMRPEAYEIASIKLLMAATKINFPEQIPKNIIEKLNRMANKSNRDYYLMLPYFFDYKKDFTEPVMIEGKSLEQWKQEILEIILECEDLNFFLTAPQTKELPITLIMIQKDAPMQVDLKKLPLFLGLMAYLNFIYEGKFLFEDIFRALAEKMVPLSYQDVGALTIVTHQLNFYRNLTDFPPVTTDVAPINDLKNQTVYDFCDMYNQIAQYRELQLAEPLLSLYTTLSEFGLVHLTIQSKNMTEWFLFPKIFASVIQSQPFEPVQIVLERQDFHKDKKKNITFKETTLVATDIPDFYTKNFIHHYMNFFVNAKDTIDLCIKKKKNFDIDFLKNNHVMNAMVESYREIIKNYFSRGNNLESLIKNNINIFNKIRLILSNKSETDGLAFIFLHCYGPDIKDFYERTCGYPMVVPENLSVTDELYCILRLHQEAIRSRSLPSETPEATEASPSFLNLSLAISD